MDILWRPEFNRPDDDYRDFHETWLRVAKNVGQSRSAGGGVRDRVAPGSSSATPSPATPQPFTTWPSSATTTFLLTASARAPAWRQSSDDAFVARTLTFNRWLKAQADQRDGETSQMSLLDSTNLDPSETAGYVAGWVRRVRDSL